MRRPAVGRLSVELPALLCRLLVATPGYFIDLFSNWKRLVMKLNVFLTLDESLSLAGVPPALPGGAKGGRVSVCYSGELLSSRLKRQSCFTLTSPGVTSGKLTSESQLPHW